jgi:S1-C subfamily serine protease
MVRCLWIASLVWISAGLAVLAEEDQVKLFEDAQPRVALVEVTLSNGNESIARSGTAFAVTADNVLVTCHHIVDGAKEVVILLPKLYPIRVIGEVIGVDASRDLAAVKVKSTQIHPAFDVPNIAPKKATRVMSIGYTQGREAWGMMPGTLSVVWTKGSLKMLSRTKKGDPLSNITEMFGVAMTPVRGHSGGPIVLNDGTACGMVAFADFQIFNEGQPNEVQGGETTLAIPISEVMDFRKNLEKFPVTDKNSGKLPFTLGAEAPAPPKDDRFTVVSENGTPLEPGPWVGYSTAKLGPVTQNNSYNSQMGSVLLTNDVRANLPKRSFLQNQGLGYSFGLPDGFSSTEQLKVFNLVQNNGSWTADNVFLRMTLQRSPNEIVHVTAGFFQPQTTLQQDFANLRVSHRRGTLKLYLANHDEKYPDDGIERTKVGFGMLDQYISTEMFPAQDHAFQYRNYYSLTDNRGWLVFYMLKGKRFITADIEMPQQAILDRSRAFQEMSLIPLSIGAY